MNRQKEVVVGLSMLAGTFITGVGVGAAVVRTWLEKGLRADYEERGERMKRAYEIALLLEKDKEFDFNEVAVPEAETPTEHIPVVIFEEPVVDPDEEQKESTNPYHKAVAATDTSVEMFVSGGINDYGVSYIEEEDYHDDGDGFFKGRVDIIMNDGAPIFMMDGQPIDDWDKRLGDSILVDFFTKVPPGVEPVLYVRNHRTTEDYEVVQVLP